MGEWYSLSACIYGAFFIEEIHFSEESEKILKKYLKVT